MQLFSTPPSLVPTRHYKRNIQEPQGLNEVSSCGGSQRYGNIGKIFFNVKAIKQMYLKFENFSCMKIFHAIFLKMHDSPHQKETTHSTPKTSWISFLVIQNYYEDIQISFLSPEFDQIFSSAFSLTQIVTLSRNILAHFDHYLK